MKFILQQFRAFDKFHYSFTVLLSPHRRIAEQKLAKEMLLRMLFLYYYEPKSSVEDDAFNNNCHGHSRTCHLKTYRTVCTVMTGFRLNISVYISNPTL